MEKKGTIEEAVQCLITAVEVAQSKGAYTFNDAANIIGAVNFLKEELPKLIAPIEDREDQPK
jgi:hypothetical protein